MTTEPVASVLIVIVRSIRMPGTVAVRSAAAATGFGLNGLSPPLELRKELATTRTSSSERTPAACRRRRESGSRAGVGGACRFFGPCRNCGDTSVGAGTPTPALQSGCAPGGGVEVGGAPDK